MFGNWTFTATRAGCPVGEIDAASTAWWTCPIDAAAKGMGLKSANEERHDGPREDAITRWNPKNISPQVDCRSERECGSHLHLPVGHVVSAVLNAAKDAVEIRW